MSQALCTLRFLIPGIIVGWSWSLCESSADEDMFGLSAAVLECECQYYEDLLGGGANKQTIIFPGAFL